MENKEHRHSFKKQGLATKTLDGKKIVRTRKCTTCDEYQTKIKFVRK